MTVQATHPRTESRTVRAGREWTPLALGALLLRHRALIRQLIGRDIAQRYRGSYLGLAWSFLVPLLTLGVYTVVFSAILQARWGPEERTPSVGEFALILFAGLVPFNLLAECLTRAPGLITGTPQYVKKVIFPVEVLPVVLVGSAAVHSLIALGALVAGVVALLGRVHPAMLLAALAYVPLVLLALGLAWFLAALGVYVRDIGQGIGVVVQILIFLTPIFYPVSAVPVWLRGVLALNPLTTVVDVVRAALFWPQTMPWEAWALWTLAGAALAWLGYAWFMVSRHGFADVL